MATRSVPWVAAGAINGSMSYRRWLRLQQICRKISPSGRDLGRPYGRQSCPTSLLFQWPRCFCCFCRKLSAAGLPCAAEILDCRRCGERKNSGTTGDTRRLVRSLVNEKFWSCMLGVMASDQEAGHGVEYFRCLNSIIITARQPIMPIPYERDLLRTYAAAGISALSRSYSARTASTP